MLPSRPKAVLISLVASYLLSALLLFILTFVLYRLKLKESQIAPAVYALYAISCFAGGLLCGKALRTRRFFWGLLTGVLYFLALFTASLLLRHGLVGFLLYYVPFLAAAAALLLQFFRRLKTRVADFSYCTLLFSAMMACATSLIAGHVLVSPSVSLMVAILYEKLIARTSAQNRALIQGEALPASEQPF